LWRRRLSARADGVVVSRRRVDCADADDCMDDYIFCRIRGGKLSLLDRERNFSTRDPRIRDRDLLCSRNACGWRVRAVAVRLDHWRGVKHRTIYRVLGRGGGDDVWSDCRTLALCFGRAASARARGRAGFEPGLTAGTRESGPAG